jgi:hypothetical protein
MGKMNFAGIRIAFAFGLITMFPFAGFEPEDYKKKIQK